MTVMGPDGSVYQLGIQLSPDDWADVGFGMWRAIHQSGRLDVSYRPMRDEFEQRAKPFAAYVWVDATDPSKKADQTVAAVADTSVPVMVDWEDHDCSFARMVAYVDAMRVSGYQVTMLYTGRSFWQEMGAPRLDGLGVDLVVARYGNQNPAQVYDAEHRYADMARYSVWDWNLGGLSPSVWQFGSRILWGNKPMDMNAVEDPAVIGRCFQTWQPTPIPKPPSPRPPTSPVEVYDMVPMIGKMPNNGGWLVSFDGGLTCRTIRSKSWADAVIAGGAVDVLDKVIVTDWGQVAGFATVAQAREFLGTDLGGTW